jgi:predicted amidohydrolase YtcJ
MDALFFRDAEIAGLPGLDCLIADGRVQQIGSGLARPADAEEIPGRGGALLPGLADHHIHLLAMAAAANSADLTGTSRLEAVVGQAARTVPAGQWARVTGYDDQAHGALDRHRLDRCAADAPVRVQHRGGGLWVLNSRAAELIGLDQSAHPGVERDGAGRPTGRLWRADELLRAIPAGPPPDLASVGRRLAEYGVTAVTDASPDDDGSAAPLLSQAVLAGALPQRVQVMGPVAASCLTLGPRKLVVSDHEYPELGELSGRIRDAHAASRPVALHCVSRTALMLALAALDEVGARAGDRIEHCAVADAGTIARMAAMGLTVITQPSLVALRGDDYRGRCSPADHDDLWRYASLLGAGVRTAPSSDAPYGDPDPWRGMRAASRRRTRSGAILGKAERVSARTVLAALLSPLDSPGGRPRQLAPGSAADLVLLDRPLAAALRAPSADRVCCTVIHGKIMYKIS